MSTVFSLVRLDTRFVEPLAAHGRVSLSANRSRPGPGGRAHGAQSPQPPTAAADRRRGSGEGILVVPMAIFMTADGPGTVPKWLIQRELHPERDFFRPGGLTSKQRSGILDSDGSTPGDGRFTVSLRTGSRRTCGLAACGWR